MKEYERIIPGDNTMWNVCSIVTYFYFHLSLVLVLFMGIWCLGEEGMRQMYWIWIDIETLYNYLTLGTWHEDTRSQGPSRVTPRWSIVILYWGALWLPVDTSTLINLLKTASLFFNFPYHWLTICSGGVPGWALWPGQPLLGEAVCGQDAGDREQGGHPCQLRRGQGSRTQDDVVKDRDSDHCVAGHSTLDNGRWVWVPAGGQLHLPLPAHLAAAAGHQEDGARQQDCECVLLTPQAGTCE